MCLMAFALHPHPTVALVLASNRDEVLSRPTRPLHNWITPLGTAVWAGRDEREGGTWAGFAPGGRVGLLTNVRDAVNPAFPRSRGELVTRWLDTASHTPDARAATDAFVAWLGPLAGEYGGFNLVLGDAMQGHWLWLNNRPWVAADMPDVWRHRLARPHDQLLTLALVPGVYGMSNAGLDTPWPKTLALTAALQQALARAQPPTKRSAPAVAEAPTQAEARSQAPWPALPGPQFAAKGSGWTGPLWQALCDRHTYADVSLPRTGVPAAAEKALSAAFVDMPWPVAGGHTGYGTRSSLVAQITRGGDTRATGRPATTPPWRAELQERTWRPETQAGWSQATWTCQPPPSGHDRPDMPGC